MVSLSVTVPSPFPSPPPARFYRIPLSYPAVARPLPTLLTPLTPLTPQPSAADCCKHCRETAGCNVWVWCAAADGCGNGRAHKECWLKKEELKAVLDFEAFTSPTIPWTSGALYSDADRDALLSAEARRLQTLKADKSLPLVFFDVEIKGKPVGRIQFVLFVKEAPRAAENFRQLCTGAPPHRFVCMHRAHLLLA